MWSRWVCSLHSYGQDPLPKRVFIVKVSQGGHVGQMAFVTGAYQQHPRLNLFGFWLYHFLSTVPFFSN